MATKKRRASVSKGFKTLTLNPAPNLRTYRVDRMKSRDSVEISWKRTERALSQAFQDSVLPK